MRVKILTMKFCKSDSEVEVKVGLDELRKVVQSNDQEIHNVLAFIKSKIPDKYADKKVSVNVYLTVVKNDPSITTVMTYSIFLSKAMQDVSTTCSTELNKFFRKYVLETISKLKNESGKV